MSQILRFNLDQLKKSILWSLTFLKSLLLTSFELMLGITNNKRRKSSEFLSKIVVLVAQIFNELLTVPVILL